MGSVTSLIVKQQKVSKCGERNPDDVWFLFPLFPDEKKEGRKPRGKTRNAAAGKGDRQQVFTDLNCLIYLVV